MLQFDVINILTSCDVDVVVLLFTFPVELFYWEQHHKLFIITLLLRSKAKSMLAKQQCYIQTKMYRNGHFSI